MLSSHHSLIDKLNSKAAIVGVFGLGYVGLPLSLSLSEAGHPVLGFDIDPEKADQLNLGRSYIRHVREALIRRALDNGFEATTDFKRAIELDVLVLCIPTPLDDNREPDLGFVTGTLDALQPHLRANQLMVLESTTWPGTTEEVIRPRLEGLGFTIGENYFLAYSPEREDPGNEEFNTHNIPKVISGCTPACLEAVSAFYRDTVARLVPVSSTRAAEMTKLLENIHRAVNIGLVNELKLVCDKMDIDIYEVIEAAATKPFGFVPYYPGPGLGGHCLPIDPFYLSWKARQFGIETRFIELAGRVNHSMPGHVVEKVKAALATNGQALEGSRVLVLGIAYKKNVDDTRESPAVEIMHQLTQLGADVAYCDPLVPVFPQMRRYRYDLRSRPFDRNTIRACDCVVLVTDHDVFDYELIRDNARLVVDARGRLRGSDSHVWPA